MFNFRPKVKVQISIPNDLELGPNRLKSFNLEYFDDLRILNKYLTNELGLLDYWFTIIDVSIVSPHLYSKNQHEYFSIHKWEANFLTLSQDDGIMEILKDTSLCKFIFHH